MLVGEDYVLKVADFGLARDIYKDEHYVKTTSVRTIIHADGEGRASIIQKGLYLEIRKIYREQRRLFSERFLEGAPFLTTFLSCTPILAFVLRSLWRGISKFLSFPFVIDMYFLLSSQGLLPVKWMAIEALVDRVYTHKSDV